MNKIPPVCTMLWSVMDPHKDSQKVFDFKNKGSENVNRLYRGLCANLPEKPRFICITDESQGLDSDIEVHPMPDILKGMKEGWRKVWIFSRDMEKIAGSRLCYMDIDLVITGDMIPLLTRTDPVLFARFNPRGMKEVKSFNKKKRVQKFALLNSCFTLMDTDIYPEIWNSFDKSLGLLQFHNKPAYLQNYCGSDQSWLMYFLHSEFNKGNISTVGPDDGVYVFRKLKKSQGQRILPSNASVIAFGGKDNPGCETTQNQALWIKDHSYEA